MDALRVNESIRTAESVRETINQDGAVLLDIKQGLCFTMNPVGARIWEMLKKQRSLDEIASNLGTEFNVPRSQIEADITEFVGELRTRNLIAESNHKTIDKSGWIARLLRRAPRLQDR